MQLRFAERTLPFRANLFHAARVLWVMNTDATSRPNDLTLCHQIIAEQQSTIGELQRELQQAKHYVERLLHSKYGPGSERVDPNQLPLFQPDDFLEHVAKHEAVDESPVVVHEHRRRGGGRGSLADHLPREVVEHDLAVSERPCPCCGETRQRIGCETSEQLEFVPAVLKVIEHRRWKYACRRCEEQVVIAPVPNKPIAKGLPGPGLLSSVVVSKYADHLPLYRLEDVLAHSGVDFSRSFTNGSRQPSRRCCQRARSGKRCSTCCRVGTVWSATARIAPDNNLSERSVRPVAVGRKNYLFLGSDDGGKAAAVLYSVIASATANQVEPFA